MCGRSRSRAISATTSTRPDEPSSPREGAVAPVNLLSDFGSRRRIASLAALMLELETTLTDAAIALFERLTGRLFTRSRNSQDRSWSASKTQAGRLIRLFGGAIDAMVRAREDDRDPFDVLDEEIGWDRLVASREEIAALGDLATQDPLSLATQRYAQLRRFAPAFLGRLRVRRPRRRPRPAGHRDAPPGAQPHGQTHPPRHRPDAVSEPALESGHPAQRHTPTAHLRNGGGRHAA